MADVPYTSTFQSSQQPPCVNQAGEPNEAVCIDANRVYDSCGDKDCLSDMRVFFTETNQAVINNACSVRIREANVINTTVNLEPVTFHKGFYAVGEILDIDGDCGGFNLQWAWSSAICAADAIIATRK